MATLNGDVHVRVQDRSLVGAARRDLASLASRAGFDETGSGRVAITATELASNLLDHAGGGEIFGRTTEIAGDTVVEILSVDRGPGIDQVDRVLEDGFTTAPDSHGTGLGAVQRMADDFHVHSRPGVGTAILALLRSCPREEPVLRREPAIGGLRAAHPGERVSGDGWSYHHEDGQVGLVVVDGLGHGSGARDATRAALAAFRNDPLSGPTTVLRRVHEAVRATRGVAAGALQLDEAEGEVRFAGVGNVLAAIVGREKKHLLTRNGMLGLRMPNVREYRYSCAEGCTLVVHTDGIQGRWSRKDAAPLLNRPPTLLAGFLYLLRSRGRDDATVVALRRGDPGP